MFSDVPDLQLGGERWTREAHWTKVASVRISAPPKWAARKKKERARSSPRWVQIHPGI